MVIVGLFKPRIFVLNKINITIKIRCFRFSDFVNILEALSCSIIFFLDIQRHTFFHLFGGCGEEGGSVSVTFPHGPFINCPTNFDIRISLFRVNGIAILPSKIIVFVDFATEVSTKL